MTGSSAVGGTACQQIVTIEPNCVLPLALGDDVRPGQIGILVAFLGEAPCPGRRRRGSCPSSWAARWV